MAMNLLTLPYDIRHQIYTHLLPPTQQIYAQVLGNELRAITSEHHCIPTELLLTCTTLNAEASEYLYNSYLFNIVGSKRDCLANYKRFLAVVQKHARYEVHVDAFSNGDHSKTMCISIQAGEGKMAILKKRERGEPKTIEELEREVRLSSGAGRISNAFKESLHLPMAAAVLMAALVAVLAWYMNE